MKLYFVYILKCKDNSFYTGFTNNLDRRLYEHNAGLSKDSYTYDKRPVELLWFEMFTEPTQAILIEKKISFHKDFDRLSLTAVVKE